MKILIKSLIFLFMLYFVSERADGQENQYNNIVKITSFYQDSNPEPGFGFVVYEEYEELYVVTAKHVIEEYDKELKRITVDFYEREESQTLARVKNKSADFSFRHISLISQPFLAIRTPCLISLILSLT